mmetsp:Transcript_21644/g.56469  ORF Transcript_21644/g.56469 Transcript_21644/m.56469 type:complete len:370 (+) Transcript_21644:1368-2477(+)
MPCALGWSAALGSRPRISLAISTAFFMMATPNAVSSLASRALRSICGCLSSACSTSISSVLTAMCAAVSFLPLGLLMFAFCCSSATTVFLFPLAVAACSGQLPSFSALVAMLTSAPLRIKKLAVKSSSFSMARWIAGTPVGVLKLRSHRLRTRMNAIFSFFCCRACQRGVLPTSSISFTSAPRAHSLNVTSSRSALIAWFSADVPSAVLLCTLAPRSSMKSAEGASLRMMHWLSTVVPSFSASMSAPADSSHSATSTIPLCSARASAPSPLFDRSERSLRMPSYRSWSSSRRTISFLPFTMASIIGVRNSQSWALMAARLPRSASTTSYAPLVHAKCSGVSSRSFARLVCAPTSIRKSADELWPSRIAA